MAGQLSAAIGLGDSGVLPISGRRGVLSQGSCVWGPCLFFVFFPHIQPDAAPCFTQPSGMEVTRTTLVQSFLIPTIGSNPQSRAKQELVL